VFRSWMLSQIEVGARTVPYVALVKALARA
jgi:hypothetical protein